ncbi:MAG: ankyrin repeat domain-containing protein [Acidobacteria bacterium]|nr:ankyrin repeat domain-containing protein [Acidobacteriota bacterium]
MKFPWLLGAGVLVAVSVAGQTTDTQQSLMQAIQRGDTAAVSRALDSGINPNIADPEGAPALMLATLFADVACVELLLKRGADPNRADGGGATPLMWAIPDIAKARLLIQHGANLNTRSSNLGRTPLLIAAGYPGTVDLLALLLASGADLRVRDGAGFNALAIAMQSADVEVVRYLVGRGLDPKDQIPAVALRAAYGRPRPALVDYLVSRGLPVLEDALVGAVNWHPPSVTQRWIDQGANVNARGGSYNVTPLLRAASSEWAGSETVRLLLERGADPNAETTEGERALDWAIYRADTAKIAVLEKFGATRGRGPRRQPLPPPPSGTDDPRLAVSRSVALLLKSAPPMYEQRRCYTCHHNTAPAEAAALARRAGIAVPEALARENLDDILAVLRPAAGPAMQGRANIPGGVALTAGYGLMALAAEAYPADTVTASMTHWLLATQMPDGTWISNGASRPPIEFSTVSHTAIAVRGLTLYPLPGRRPQIDRALERAQRWLLTADAPTAEDRAMRLMGLVWTKAPESARTAAVQDILRRQAATGGWSQLPQLDPDAYATGLSLVALHAAGVRVTDDAYRKGVRFLLTTQYPDGSWLVRTRSFPIQPYFESGFPFGPHQWISAAGTAWAAQAIALTLPDRR